MRPVVLRDGAPEEIDPLTAGGVVEFGEPIGAAETIHTLHSELLTFGDSFGCRAGELQAFPVAGSALDPPGADGGPGGGDPADRRRGVPALGKTVSVHLVEASGGGRSVRVRALTEPQRALGPGRRDRLDRGAGGGRGAAARPGERSRPGARCPPSAASSPAEMFAELERARLHLRDHDPGGGAGVKVGVPTEIKADEYRVALTPVGARELAEHGHEVLIQRGAGEGSAISDAHYEAQGARIVPTAARRLRRGRPGPEGEGAPAPRRSRCWSPTRPCSRTCTWPRRRI